MWNHNSFEMRPSLAWSETCHKPLFHPCVAFQQLFTFARLYVNITHLGGLFAGASLGWVNMGASAPISFEKRYNCTHRVLLKQRLKGNFHPLIEIPNSLFKYLAPVN